MKNTASPCLLLSKVLLAEEFTKYGRCRVDDARLVTTHGTDDVRYAFHVRGSRLLVGVLAALILVVERH